MACQYRELLRSKQSTSSFALHAVGVPAFMLKNVSKTICHHTSFLLSDGPSDCDLHHNIFFACEAMEHLRLMILCQMNDA